MNIFILSWNIQECAKWHFDKHVIKMILELAQLLSTAHWIASESNERRVLKMEKWNAKGKLYKKTHKNHPCAVWTRYHINNYRFVAKLAKALCYEYYVRYGEAKNKRHKTETIIDYLILHEPKVWPECNDTLIGCHNVTNPAQAMPIEYKDINVLTAYKKYYQSPEKQHLSSWKSRERPAWFK
jgi:hypothetical protein